MKCVIRAAVKDDEPFLWKMLYYAAHVEEEGETALDAVKRNSGLVRYVRDWGRERDVGSIALEVGSNRPIGAAWMRVLVGDEKTGSYVDDVTPELAIAVLPEYVGKGVGTQLLTHVLEAAKEHYSAVVLSVRINNPAKRLYERMGFVLVGKTTNRVGTESFNMVMRFS